MKITPQAADVLGRSVTDERASELPIPLPVQVSRGAIDPVDTEGSCKPIIIYIPMAADSAVALDYVAALLNLGVTPDEVKGLVRAATNALPGISGGQDQAPCHQGITARAKCPQCQRVDGLIDALMPFGKVD